MMHSRPFRVVLAVAVLAGPASRLAAAQVQRSVFLEDHTWPELQGAIAGGATTVLIASGSVEQTGPHVVLGKHNMRATVYAEKIALALGRTLVAPIVPAAPTSEALRKFPGTINVRPEIFAAFNAEIARSMAAAGFRTVILLGDHGGNQAPLKALAAELDVELSPRGTRVFFAGDGYEKATAEIEALAQTRGLVAAGHGGLWDTAETWAVSPDGVRPSQFAAGDTTAAQGMDARGVSGDPSAATEALGREFVDIRVKNAVAQIRGFLRATAR